MTRLSHSKASVSSATQQGTHPVARLPASDTTATGLYDASHFQSRYICDNTCRRGIIPFPLKQIRTIDTGGPYLDQHIRRTIYGYRPFLRLQHFRTTRTFDDDGLHITIMIWKDTAAGVHSVKA